MMGGKHSRVTLQLDGPLGLIAAILKRAQLDVKAGNGYAEEAREFLESGEVIAFLSNCGVEPEYYLRLLRGNGPDVVRERTERICWLAEIEMVDRAGIAMEVFGAATPHTVTLVSRELGAARAQA